jgi:predicted nucleic acid-binding protein
VILADTSVWVDHLRRPEAALVSALLANQVVVHPFVIGEIALGSLARREQTLRNLRRLPGAVTASDAEAMSLIEREQLLGLGIGYVDVHLLASARLTPGTTIWTRDRRLAAVATKLGLAQSP